jgi:hypothetical protein
VKRGRKESESKVKEELKESGNRGRRERERRVKKSERGVEEE